MRQRIYIDTSVFGGHFDEEFKDHTIPLFDRIKSGEFMVRYSTVTQEELENAPEQVKELVQSLRADLTEFIETTDEAVDLAIEYNYCKSCWTNKFCRLFTHSLSNHKSDRLFSELEL